MHGIGAFLKTVGTSQKNYSCCYLILTALLPKVNMILMRTLFGFPVNNSTSTLKLHEMRVKVVFPICILLP
jgi:hypothetical protein